MTRTHLVALVLAATACEGGAAIGPTDGETHENVLVAGATYSDLRALENIFPIPAGSQNINVGTLDPSSGTFTGIVSTQQCELDPILHKPHCYMLPPEADINAVGAVLVFHTPYYVSPFRVTVDGVTTTAPTGATSISVDVRRAKNVHWTLTSGGATASDQLNIGRPGVIGAGVFTVGALPISLLYEPPQSGSGLSYTSITTTEKIGSSISVTHEQEESTSRPSFAGIYDINDKLQTLKSIIQLYPGLSSPILNGTIDRITSAFGTQTSNTIEGTDISTEHTLELSSSTQLGYSTNAGLGPGAGDRVIYLRDAQIAWVMIDGDITLALIGYGARAAYTIQQLKSDRAMINAGMLPANTVSMLDLDSLNELIALDPMANVNPIRGVSLPTSRYTLLGTEEGDGPETYTVAHTITTTDKSSHKSFNASETDFHAGWLGALGLGPDSSTHKMTTSVSEQRSNSVSSDVSATLHMEGNVGSPYRVDVYFDNIFSTFLAKNPGSGGIIVGNGGVLMAH